MKSCIFVLITPPQYSPSSTTSPPTLPPQQVNVTSPQRRGFPTGNRRALARLERERERERERELVGIQASAEAALVVYRLEDSRKDSQIALPPKCHVTHLWPYTRPYTRQASVVIALVVYRLEGIVALEGLLRLSLPFCPF